MPDEKSFEAFERLLSASLTRVLDLLKFAETKNAALLTFSSAWVLALINASEQTWGAPPRNDPFFLAALAMFGAACMICIKSFLPKIKIAEFNKPKDGSKELLFFGDVAQLSIDSFREKATARYMMQGGPPSISQKYLDDLCSQISINSDIATGKFRSFNISAYLVLVAVIVVSIRVAINILAKW